MKKHPCVCFGAPMAPTWPTWDQAQMVLHGVLEMEASGPSTYQKFSVNLGMVEGMGSD